MKNYQLVIEYLDTGEIIPYKNNAKQHPQWQIQQIADSIEQFGFNDPIAIDENNVIIEGHGRLLAAKKLGISVIPVIRLSYLSENERKAYIIVHNKLTMNTEFDIEILNEELSRIDDIDMSAFGFDDAIEPDKDAVEDDYAVALTSDPVSRIGDIYILGRHVVMCGDSTSRDDVLRLVGSDKIDMLITDPPYGVDYTGGTKDKLKIKNDDLPEQAFLEFLTKAFCNASEVMRPGAAAYIWCGESARSVFADAMRAANIGYRQTLVWVKNAFVIGRQDYQWRHESCLYGWKDGGSHYFTPERTWSTVFGQTDAPNFDKMTKDEAVSFLKEIYETSTVIYENKPKANDLHPTMKPVPLFGRMIINSSKKDDFVLDLFCGSGTTVIACEQLGRSARVMEYDPRYCDAIVKRWEEYTGQKAKLIRD